jgi:type I restriction enzyme, R subunit
MRGRIWRASKTPWPRQRCSTICAGHSPPSMRAAFRCFGKLFHVAYFALASGLNSETKTRYEANRLTITRQLKYSPKHTGTLDVTLAINGIPVAMAKLKNPMTAQTWWHAVAQYKNDRDPADLIFRFKRRALVHFAVDTDED